MSCLKKYSWLDFGITSIGPLHVKEGLPNQDSFLIKDYKNVKIIALSDGLGSKEYSDIGSKSVCQAVSTVFQIYRHFENLPLEKPEIIFKLIWANWAMYIGKYFNLDDCCATCLFAIEFKEKILLGSFGDGMVVAIGESRDDSFILNLDKDDAFSNQTFCFSENLNAAHGKLKLIDKSKYKAVVLTSDGIADDIESEEGKIEFSEGLCEEFKKQTTSERTAYMRDLLDNWPRKFHTDDKTMVCLFKK